MRSALLCPHPAAFISGGNLYNERLLSALQGTDMDLEPLMWKTGEENHRLENFDWVLVDSLYLNKIEPARFAQLSLGRRFGLLCHYIPDMETWSDAKSEEVGQRWGWLHDTFDFLVVPSPFVRRQMNDLLGFEGPIYVIPPILGRGPDWRLKRAPGPLWALMAANLTPLKGLLPLLEALDAASAEPLQDQLEFTIFGSSSIDPSYAEACKRTIEGSNALLGTVRILPPIDPVDLSSVYGLADVYVSSSFFETFGMAVCEALLHGTPVLAYSAGNVPGLLKETAGGECFDSHEALATALLERSRDPEAWLPRKAKLWADRPRHLYTQKAVKEKWRRMLEQEQAALK